MVRSRRSVCERKRNSKMGGRERVIQQNGKERKRERDTIIGS